MEDVYVIGIGMTRFDKHLDRSVKGLAAEALNKALADAGIKKDAIEAAYFSNSMWGYHAEQHCIRGQVALRDATIMGIPIYNLENACGGGATAFHSAWMGVTSGVYECALALGAEKLYSEDKAKAFRAYWSGIDVENMEAYMVQLRDVSNGLSLDIPVEDDDEGAGKNRSGAMDIYSTLTRWHMDKYGTTQRQLAVIASKNHFHSTMNPNAQFQKDMSIDEILAARLVSWPLTVPMCAPVGDGAAAAIVCSANFLKKVVSARPVCIRASVMGSGTDRDIAEDRQDISARVSQKAYEISGLGPDDIDVAELHDATAFGELQHSEAVGFCPPGKGGLFAESGATKLGGRLPINPSGGLESRGHPLGASGLGQIHEIVTQLRHEAGSRQVKNCRIGLAENGGGLIGFEGAALGIHILERLKR